MYITKIINALIKVGKGIFHYMYFLKQYENLKK